jgi:hypothetical protein
MKIAPSLAAGGSSYLGTADVIYPLREQSGGATCAFGQ